MKNVKILLFIIFGLWSYNLVSMEEGNFMTVTTADNVQYKLAIDQILQSQTLYNLSKDGVIEADLSRNISSTTFKEIFNYLKVNENKENFFFKGEEKSIKDRVDLINALAYLGIPYNAKKEKVDNTLIEKVANSLLDDLKIADFETYKGTLYSVSSTIKKVLIQRIVLWMPTFNENGKKIIQSFLEEKKLDEIIKYIKEAKIENFQVKIEKHLVLLNIICRAYIAEKKVNDCITLMKTIYLHLDLDEESVTLFAKKISPKDYMNNRKEFTSVLQSKLNALMINEIIRGTEEKINENDRKLFFVKTSSLNNTYKDYLDANINQHANINQILRLKETNKITTFFDINDDFIKDVMYMYLSYKSEVRTISFKYYERTGDTIKELLNKMMINQIIDYSKNKASKENKDFFENQSYKQYLNANINQILRLKETNKITRFFGINDDFIQEVVSMYLKHNETIANQFNVGTNKDISTSEESSVDLSGKSHTSEESSVDLSGKSHIINQIISDSKNKASKENKDFFENQLYKQYLNDNIEAILRLKKTNKITRFFDTNDDFIQEVMFMYLQHIEKASLWQKMYYKLYNPYKAVILPLLGIGSVFGARYLWQKYRKK